MIYTSELDNYNTPMKNFESKCPICIHIDFIFSGKRSLKNKLFKFKLELELEKRQTYLTLAQNYINSNLTPIQVCKTT